MPTAPAGHLPTLDSMLDGIADVVPVDLPTYGMGAQRFPFVVVRAEPWACVIRPVVTSSHLSIDLHPFVNGEPATVGMGGMTYGRMHLMPDQFGQRSNGWPSLDLGVAVIGVQD